jgi:5'-methylthioadenosine phosphorylase
MSNTEPSIGVIGGSGLYELPGMEILKETRISTPFGKPSDAVVSGKLHGRVVHFLPRHGRGHRIAPNEINHRANIYAMRSLGVRWLICVTAVGSLQENLHPRDVLVPDQLFDRTSRREHHTFFGNGIVAHVSFGEPFSPQLRKILVAASEQAGATVHDGGTYVNMDGPAFSTRAESEFNRRAGFSVIGMTNLPEVKLAREAEIACATLAMITDYDCWKIHEEPVSAAAVGAHLQANVEMARKILAAALPGIPTEPTWPEHTALNDAILTPQELWPAEQKEKISLLLQRFMA